MPNKKTANKGSARNTTRKRKGSKQAATQRFLPIGEIHNDTVLLKQGGMRAVIEVEALNFNLKSETEQQGIVAGYESFINTIGFPLQIVIRSTKVNIDPYLEQIHEKGSNQENQLLRNQTENYARFIAHIVELADIMQKRFFVVVPVDEKEQKTSVISQLLSWIGIKDSGTKARQRRRSFKEKSNKMTDRINLVQSGLQSIGLRTKRLSTRELIDLYYAIYNPRTSQEQKLPTSLNTDTSVL